MATDFIAGTVAGIAKTLVGHPFNTVKVRLQTQPTNPPKYNGGLDCFRKTLAEEGVKGLYKGMSSPLVGAGFLNALLFYSMETSKRAIAPPIFDKNEKKFRTPNLTLSQTALAGGISGVVNSFASCPIELVMVRLQTQHLFSPGKKLYRGPIDCTRQILSKFGLKGLYKGFSVTALREIPNYVAYFWTYEVFKRNLAKQQNISTDRLSPTSLFLSGGCAGVAAQVAQLPLDTVKSRIQTQADNITVGWTQVARTLYKTDGIRGFYKGIGPVLLRAFPANAATFVAFEYSLKFLQSKS